MSELTNAEMRAYLAGILLGRQVALAQASPDDVPARSVSRLYREFQAIARAHGAEGREALILLGLSELLNE